MNIIEEIYKELAKLGLSNNSHIDLQEIRNKDGIYLYRVIYENKYYILKYFLNDEYTREIKNYSILKELNIPTIKLLAYTDRALLLEDLEKSNKYRLGEGSDLLDTEVAKALATWYIDLHNKGTKYISEKDNDFYWTNLTVSNDKKEAIMFDYNLLGIGFRYNDIRNVCSSLSEEAGKIFVEEYGDINENEKTIDEGISILIDLIFAYKRPEFPDWAQESLNAVHNGELEKAFKKILDLH